MAKTYKIGVFGPQQVGKTSLTLRCCGLNPFEFTYGPTIEDSYRKSFTVDGNPCAVEFLDTGGSGNYDKIRDQWISNCGALIYVYDISDALSFGRVRQQLCDAQTFLLNLHKKFPTTPTIQIALVGNKVDKQQMREVSEKEGRQLADKYEATFWETSARDAKGFCDACIHLLKAMGAGRDASSFTTEDSSTALKQPRTDWMQLVLRHTPEWVQQHPLSAEYRGILVPIEAAQEIDEIDSAYGSDLETKVVNPSRSLSYEENGRTYHTFGRTKYWGPNDKRACELLELGHKIWKLVLPGLYAAPLEGNSSSFLDLGTGTGTWAIDVAKKYKGSEVVGIDVSDIQPRAVPQNVEFFLDDFNLENYEERARYDMIRGRDLYGSVLNWPRLIGKCFKALKPGGWLECAGSSLPIPADTLEESRVLLQWKQTFVDAGEKNGMTFDVRSKLEWWLEAAGFVEVEVKKITVPVGGRSKLGKMSLKRLDRGLFDFSGRLLSEVLGWSLARITVFLAAVRKELRKNKARVIHYQELWVRTYDPIDYSEMNTLFQVRKGLAIWEGEQDSGILDKTES
ncbi:hypothetical protein OIDMADRAFT_61815 [Oidiodendron maius Zn]|uniref:Methyltransferase domain-containing protein n=1 Tax=Oidiodendron maius (strain Zn) TaxID=913774 RepID=A0A0C3C2S1_OIDMZ|nr:hypothetical protein OIDMADRAFT_61815 [Oidiodendron maius Zn]